MKVEGRRKGESGSEKGREDEIEGMREEERGGNE